MKAAAFDKSRDAGEGAPIKHDAKETHPAASTVSLPAVSVSPAADAAAAAAGSAAAADEEDSSASRFTASVPAAAAAAAGVADASPGAAARESPPAAGALVAVSSLLHSVSAATAAAAAAAAGESRSLSSLDFVNSCTSCNNSSRCSKARGTSCCCRKETAAWGRRSPQETQYMNSRKKETRADSVSGERDDKRRLSFTKETQRPQETETAVSCRTSGRDGTQRSFQP